jgi:hypothetical protein
VRFKADKERAAREDGWRAWTDGKKLSDNPHKPRTWERIAWNSGWHQADAEFRAGMSKGEGR